MAFGFFKKLAKVAAGGISLIQKVPGINAVALVVPGASAALAAADIAKKGLNAVSPTAVAITGAADKVLTAVNAPPGSKQALAGQKAVAATKALAAKGNVGAANGLTVLGKRAAALRTAKEFRVHPTTGIVRRAGAKAPAGKGPALRS